MSQGKRHDGLYRRNGGSIWWLRVDPVTGDRCSTGCKDKKAAELWRAERERCAADPSYAAAQTATLGKWAADLLAVKASSSSAGTLDMYRTKVGHLIRVFDATCPMSSVDPRTTDVYVETRRSEDASDHTIAKELIALRGLCALAKRAGEWAGDLELLRPVGFSSGYEPRKIAMSFSEALDLIEAVPKQWRDHMFVALSTGCRRSELQNVTWHGVDGRNVPPHMSVTIRGTKTKGSARTFATVTQLQHDWLFQSWVLQAPRRWTNMNRDLADASRRAKLSFVVTPNDLRRTFASWLIEAGVTREEVAKMLGHSGTAMVFRVYGRADPEKEGESIRRRLAATPDPDPETCNVCHHRYGNPRHTLPGLVRCPACGRFAVPADLTPHAAGPACTDPSHLPACAPLPAAASVRIFGVSDGDRTRDNRSHNPVARRKRPVKP